MTKNNATDNPLLAHLLDKANALYGEASGQWPQRCWVISDGTAGMLSQCLALTRAMGIRGEDIRAVPTPLLRAFPRLAQIPGWQLTLGRKPDWLKMNQYPDLLITCGRRMAGISIGVRRLARGKTKTIHIQYPHVDSVCFDLLITPKHDDIAQRGEATTNLITSTGALNRLSPQEIAEQAATLKDFLKVGDRTKTSRKIAAVMLGGHNRRYRAKEQAFVELADALVRFAKMTGSRMILVPSRRTPQRGLKVLERMLVPAASHPEGVLIWDGKEPNPYPGILGLADYIIVTSDSVNMTCEAAITGKPLLIAELASETGRIARFHDMMRIAGHTAGLAEVLASPEQLSEPFVALDERSKIGAAVYRFFEKDASNAL